MDFLIEFGASTSPQFVNYQQENYRSRIYSVYEWLISIQFGVSKNSMGWRQIAKEFWTRKFLIKIVCVSDLSSLEKIAQERLHNQFYSPDVVRRMGLAGYVERMALMMANQY